MDYQSQLVQKQVKGYNNFAHLWFGYICESLGWGIRGVSQLWEADRSYPLNLRNKPSHPNSQNGGPGSFNPLRITSRRKLISLVLASPQSPFKSGYFSSLLPPQGEFLLPRMGLGEGVALSLPVPWEGREGCWVAPHYPDTHIPIPTFPFNPSFPPGTDFPSILCSVLGTPNSMGGEGIYSQGKGRGVFPL